MEAAFILGWYAIFGVIGLNVLSAGAAAMLHIWRGAMRPRSRIALSAVIAGLFPASSIFPVVISEMGGSAGTETLIGLGVVSVVSVAVCGLLSLPLGIVVSRKLEGGRDRSEIFE